MVVPIWSWPPPRNLDLVSLVFVCASISPGQSPHLIPPFGMTTPGSTNIAGWKMDPDGRCISYWTWGYFIAMLVYQRVISFLFFLSILCKSKIRSCCHLLRLVSKGWSPKTPWNARQILGGSMRMANFLAMSRDIAGARGRSYIYIYVIHSYQVIQSDLFIPWLEDKGHLTIPKRGTKNCQVWFNPWSCREWYVLVMRINKCDVSLS